MADDAPPLLDEHGQEAPPVEAHFADIRVPAMGEQPPGAKLTDPARGLLGLGFIDHYAVMEATRRRAVQRAFEEPLPRLAPVAPPAALDPSELPAPPPVAKSPDAVEVVADAAVPSEPEPEPVLAADPVLFAELELELAPTEEPTVAPSPRPKPVSARASRRAAPVKAPVEKQPPKRRDRRGEVVERLRSGPASAQELADLFGISREGVLRWLRLLEADGTIRSTATARTSRTNRWVLVDGPAPDAGVDPDSDVAADVDD